MSRTITAALSAALQLSTIRPVLIGRLDIATDPVYAWTGPGIYAPSGTADSILNGISFDPVAPFVSVSDIQEDQGIGKPVTMIFSGHDVDEELLIQVVRDKRAWRGKNAYLWLGLLDTNEYSVIADPTRIKTGVITQMKTMRTEETAVVEVIIDQDLGNAKSAPFRWLDHTRLFSSDTFSTYMIKLGNRPQGFEDMNIKGGIFIDRRESRYDDD